MLNLADSKLLTFSVLALGCLTFSGSPGFAAEAKPRRTWAAIVGSISVADLNSKCDVVVIGRVKISTDVSANPTMTEIHVTKVLAAKSGLEREFDFVITNKTGSKAILLYGLEPPVRNSPDVVLLSGGEYLFWLNKRTSATGSVPLPVGGASTRSTSFEATDSRRSVFSISDPELLRIIHSMPIQPYAWQGEMVAECVGTNDINKFVSISYQLARALRPKADSVLELTALTKVKSNPALAKIASQHLTRGVTNNFSYVNLRFLDNNP